MDINKERKKFEESITKQCGFNPEKSFELGSTGEYKSDVTFFAWAMWLTSVKREGFVLVPRFLSDEIAGNLANDKLRKIQSLFDYEHRSSTITHKEQSRLRWLRITARRYQETYESIIEAQEQSND